MTTSNALRCVAAILHLQLLKVAHAQPLGQQGGETIRGAYDAPPGHYSQTHAAPPLWPNNNNGLVMYPPFGGHPDSYSNTTPGYWQPNTGHVLPPGHVSVHGPQMQAAPPLVGHPYQAHSAAVPYPLHGYGPSHGPVQSTQPRGSHPNQALTVPQTLPDYRPSYRPQVQATQPRVVGHHYQARTVPHPLPGYEPQVHTAPPFVGHPNQAHSAALPGYEPQVHTAPLRGSHHYQAHSAAVPQTLHGYGLSYGPQMQAAHSRVDPYQAQTVAYTLPGYGPQMQAAPLRGSHPSQAQAVAYPWHGYVPNYGTPVQTTQPRVVDRPYSGTGARPLQPRASHPNQAHLGTVAYAQHTTLEEELATHDWITKVVAARDSPKSRKYAPREDKICSAIGQMAYRQALIVGRRESFQCTKSEQFAANRKYIQLTIHNVPGWPHTAIMVTDAGTQQLRYTANIRVGHDYYIALVDVRHSEVAVKLPRDLPEYWTTQNTLYLRHRT